MKNTINHIIHSAFLKTISLLFIFILFIQSIVQSQPIAITVSGQVNGTSLAQGATFQWSITGLNSGSVVTNQLWFDKDADGILNPSVDLLFLEFQQTDGVQGSNGPGDDDGVANGVITTNVGGEYFPVSKYIFKTTANGNSAFSTFSITALQVITYTISGTVTNIGVGMNDIVVLARNSNSNGEYFALTNSSGMYTINTDFSMGSNIEIKVANDGFNSVNLSGYVITPSKISTSINSNITGANFSAIAAKIITGKVVDDLNNPIAGYSVYANPGTGGNSYYGETNSLGVYAIPVEVGDYKIQFGNTETPSGYIITFYNQKYINQNSDIVQVTSLTDSVKNINAQIHKGALITGTFKKNGSPTQGSISVSNYNVAFPENRLFESWYNANNNKYYLYVLPGTYSVFFQLNNSNTSMYFNQSASNPGTAVVVNSVNDVIDNINVDFSAAVPIKFKLFTATIQHNKSLLQWTVADEMNEKTYIVEHSLDGTIFNELGSVVATGMTTYSYVDLVQRNGINYYRIKSVDNNGAFSYSNAVNVNYKVAKVVDIFPNPVLNNVATLQLKGFEAGLYTLKVYDATGKIIQQENINISAVNSTFPITLVTKGMNILEICGQNNRVVKSVFVQ